MNQYLQASEIVDYHHPNVLAKAQELATSCRDPDNIEAIACACFEWVRDHIQHSGDAKLAGNANTASEVLEAGNAWCFGKSHLLAALLRANDIPAALCYQRLRKGDAGGFTLHGLNSILLPRHGWYRVDPRGNKPGVDAQFTPPHEQLAWPTSAEGEIDFMDRFTNPQSVIGEWASANVSYQQAWETLHDTKELIKE